MGAELESGAVFAERYHIGSILGRGNFSTVYHATQKVFDVPLREVALKVFKEGAVNADNAREVFNDAVKLAGLEAEKPPQAVREKLIEILDGGVSASDGGQAYLTMELVDGKPLSHLVKRYSGIGQTGGLPVEMSLYYLRQILIALDWLHTLDPPAVHGDLHFGNVLASEEGAIRLADFGLAARLPSPVTGGAIKCQAPETLLGRFGDCRSDVYAVGLMWYEMLTGQYPFQSDALEEMSLKMGALSAERDAHKAAGRTAEAEAAQASYLALQRRYVNESAEIRKTPPRAASELNAELRDHLALEDVLQACLAYRPSERYAHAGALRKAIEGYIDGTSMPAIPTGRKTEEEAPTLAAEQPEKYADQARRLAERGEFAQAYESADKVISMEPKSARGWLAKGEVAVAATVAASSETRIERMKEALSYVVKARNLAPDSPEVLELQAKAYRAGHQTQLAERAAAEARKLKAKAVKRRRAR